jgi:hypothetical protein
MSSALFAEIILYVANYTIERYYEIIIVTSAVLSLFFLFVPETSGESKLSKVRKQLLKRHRITQSHSSQSVEMLPLQYFSMDESAISAINDGSIDKEVGAIPFEDYE